MKKWTKTIDANHDNNTTVVKREAIGNHHHSKMVDTTVMFWKTMRTTITLKQITACQVQAALVQMKEMMILILTLGR